MSYVSRPCRFPHYSHGHCRHNSHPRPSCRICFTHVGFVLLHCCSCRYSHVPFLHHYSVLNMLIVLSIHHAHSSTRLLTIPSLLFAARYTEIIIVESAVRFPQRTISTKRYTAHFSYSAMLGTQHLHDSNSFRMDSDRIHTCLLSFL